MDKAGKIYVKAMNKYNDGYIDKALELCEKSISINSANSAALNLKGILYYLKGDLDNAKKMWNISYKRNNDEVSKKYLRDAIKDKEKLQLYINALELIKQLNISEALEILKQCGNSHFNFINVNNNISLCYIKQGEYDKALNHINEVLKVDKRNTQASTNKKTLIEYGNLKKEMNYKKILIVTASIFLITSILFIGKIYMHTVKDISIAGIEKIQSGINRVRGKNKGETKSLENIEINKLEGVKKDAKVENQDTGKKEVKPSENKADETSKFPQELFTESIKSKNMEQINEYINKWQNADLTMNQKLLVIKGQEIIKSDGVQYFYEKGTSYIKENNFVEAQKYLLYALPYSKDNYLQEHIIYMLAVNYKANSDFENAIKYYEMSLKQFPSGTYAEEVLYNLIIINKDVNKDKAKAYAQMLTKQFPNSQYNNTIVKDILK
ncbi:tetratricopeptide repeat protein [Clostridium sp. CS001]|uniref:tetratricopeptide repeat protein n=1 Tax=Clostridium sp. CS001 TaxID=2880648 RepID=UPI001CF16B2A|nr:tetratricopeptide repeat protein [Clostridium sp. CS001]MCB2290247.1 tetratricopeptide repeat protein [Clostridium sp. CS001]